jgi:integrase
MPSVFKKSYTMPIPDAAERVEHEGEPAVRFKRKGKWIVAPLTADGTRCRLESPTWYGWVAGQAVRLNANKQASEIMLGELLRKAALGQANAVNPYEEHHKRPLADHLADYRLHLEAEGDTARYIQLVVGRLERLFAGCGFQRIPDIDAGKVQRWLHGLRQDGEARTADLPPGKALFTLAEAADALGLSRQSVSEAVRRHDLPREGKGRTLRLTRPAVETLRDRTRQGASIQTSNYYLSHLKSFCNWLVDDVERTEKNPVARLEPGNADADRRHHRRELTADELRRLLAAARDSARTFRGLTGRARHTLYALACGTGLRADALASLTPTHFDLDGDPPTVNVTVRRDKSRKGKVQPIPPDVAQLLREYMAGHPANLPLWPGPWAEHFLAAEMLRIDLAAAGIPYAVEGPDGPEYADFHALRHSYITLGARAGIDLRTLQELAGHSTPTLTARYSHVRLRDLGGAVGRLPSLLPFDRLPETQPQQLRATGTDGPTHCKRAASDQGDETQDEAESEVASNHDRIANPPSPVRIREGPLLSELPAALPSSHSLCGRPGGRGCASGSGAGRSSCSPTCPGEMERTRNGSERETATGKRMVEAPSG